MDQKQAKGKAALVEPLTEREEEVLRLLVERLRYQDIAKQLHMALSSVKGITREIYAKLGVDNRWDAIARAQAFGLLNAKESSSPVSAAASPAPSWPSGIVTFLFTDIEGSTPLWETMPEAMQAAVAQHHALLRQAIESSGGQVTQIVGDAFQAAFRLVSDGLCAALAAQRALRDAHWGPTGPLKVRMGLHTGPAELDPFGNAPYAVSHTLNRAARIMSAGFGGQILLSQEAADLVVRDMPQGVRLKDLGDHHLKGMNTQERLFQIVAPDLPQGFPVLPTAITRPNNLPVQLTSFIGREAEIKEVQRLLTEHRLVTLFGSGGTGKTRLSLEVAAHKLQDFPDGIWFIELAPLYDPVMVPQVVAAGMGLQRVHEISYPELLTNFLREKHLLLILDNCEHLLDACARLVDTLLHGCPHLTILTSSREALGISGEFSYRVPSLFAPEPSNRSTEELSQIEAVRLFEERAKAAQPDFHLTEKALPAAAHLCHRLDGIPLAIELAAARVNVLSVEQLAARLDDRFRLLTGGSRTALTRQRTLRASIDWSYSLLSETERQLLQRLSVFSGGWTLEAAEQVCAFDGIAAWEILDGLTSLVNKSLVMTEALPNGENRYHLLETISQFAQEKLDDGGQGRNARDHHLDYFLALAEDYGPLLHTPRIVELLDRLDLELDNLRGAIVWAIGQATQDSSAKVVRIMHDLLYFWLTRALTSEIIAWVESVLPFLSNTDTQGILLRAKAMFLPGYLLTVYLMDIGKAKEHLEESIYLYRQTGDRPGLGLALSLYHLSLSLLVSSSFKERFGFVRVKDEAIISTYHEGLGIASELLISQEGENRWTGANILLWSGFALAIDMTLDKADQMDKARSLLYQASGIFHEIGDQLGEINILPALAGLISSEKEATSLLPSIERGVNLALQIKSKFTLFYIFSNGGTALYYLKRYPDVITYFQWLYRISESYPWNQIFAVRMIGAAYYQLEDFPLAHANLQQSIEMSIRIGHDYGIYASFIYLSGILAKSGQSFLAVKLLGFLEKQYENFYKGMDRLDRIEYNQIKANLEQAVDQKEFHTLWEQGREMTLEEALNAVKDTANINQRISQTGNHNH